MKPIPNPDKGAGLCWQLSLPPIKISWSRSLWWRRRIGGQGTTTRFE